MGLIEERNRSLGKKERNTFLVFLSYVVQKCLECSKLQKQLYKLNRKMTSLSSQDGYDYFLFLCTRLSSGVKSILFQKKF